MSKAENINSRALYWARERSGLSAEDVASKANIAAKKGMTAAERILLFEAGEEFPTFKQIEDLAKVYAIPSFIFFMDTPPKVEQKILEFRNTGEPLSKREQAIQDRVVTESKTAQMIASDLLKEEDAKRFNLVSHIDWKMPISDAVKEVRKLLGYELTQLPNEFATNSENMFKDVRTRIEHTGIYVKLQGDFGSYKNRIDTNIFRGFALVDDFAPMIVINANDAWGAKCFTLLHEFVHILVGETRLNSLAFRSTARVSDKIEQFANDIASEFYLPSERLDNVGQITDFERVLQISRELSKQYNISSMMIVYRLYHSGKITSELYSSTYSRLRAEWMRAEQNKKKQRDKSSGPDPNRVVATRLGKPLIKLVNRHLMDSSITVSKASSVFGVKPWRVNKIVEESRKLGWGTDGLRN